VIALGGKALTLEDVVTVARDGETVTLAPAARERMRASRAVVESAVREGRVVYGVTTGFGDLKSISIPAAQVRELQVNLLRSHAAGVGPAAPRDVVRAMLLLRAASLAHGASGVRPEVVDGLPRCSRATSPRTCRCRARSASGDPAPLAHLAGVLTGKARPSLAGQQMPASLALRGAGSAAHARGEGRPGTHQWHPARPR
jgi:histidine ammonia-lyase